MFLFTLFMISVFVGLQILHRRLLSLVLPDCFGKWIPWTLIGLHVPVFLYLGFRLSASYLGFRPTEAFGHGVVAMLRPLFRGALYFQAITLVNLLTWAGASVLWSLKRWWTLAPDGGPKDPGRRAFLRKTTAGGFGVLAVTGLGGAVEAYGDPEITRLDLRFPDLPEGLDGLRIVHLTDLHSGPLVGPGLLKRWRELSERERPDILAITGDFVDNQPEEMGPVSDAFRDFSAPLGRFAILGNHDYFTDPRPLWAELERLGFACLENRHRIVERSGAQLAVLGLQDPMARSGRFRGIRFGPGPMPQDVRLHLPEGPWRLCLCHRPSNWDLARETGAQLTLSGHTHGGQINLIPGVSSAKLLGPYTFGTYRHQGQVMYVSRGLGMVGLPLRIAAPPEIVVITLHRREIPSMLPANNLIG